MIRDFDCLILGSGIAGLSLALKMAERGSVCVLTKKTVPSNTNYAQGGIACVTSKEDSFQLHVEDTLDAGAGLCDEAVVRQVVAEGPERVEELIQRGVRFSQREQGSAGEYDLGKEGGHSKRRVLHAKDMTGREIERALLDAVDTHPNITVLENSVAIDLLRSDKAGWAGPRRCLGVYALDKQRNKIDVYRSPVTVLATGGCGKCYLYTTNPDIATGDGVAMAYRAGARVANMEFIQFHPTCLYHPFAKSFLISEALRGEGAVLVDKAGQSFAENYDPRGSLAPRDIVARAIDAEMKKTGAECVYLDITAKGRAFLENRFPAIEQFCSNLGIDIATQPIPVVPAAHYQCGGVWVDMDGRSSLPGLYAIGEVACTGLHGANRLASNSLLEALVLAHRCGISAQAWARENPARQAVAEWEKGNASDADELVVITHNWKEIRQLMWDYVGIVRTNKRLQRAESRLELLIRETQDFYWNFTVTADLLELRNLSLVSWLIVQSALLRKESRGLHYSLDYPALRAKAEHTFLDKSILESESGLDVTI
ncbi:MAG: L-aspartate oxidase [Blastochloris sp.]|nr:L-aspartate oxidase [Blastochloris sp.]